MATARAVRRSADARVLAVAGAVPIACLILAVMLVAVAGITWITSPYWGDNPPALARNVGTVPTSLPTAPGTHAAADPIADIVSPNRIVIPRLKATAPITPVATTDGELDIPLNPHVVGWWRFGAKPGATKGTAILAGHINYSGVTGTLSDIGSLKPGDQVDVYGKQNADKRHEVKFRVTGVRTYHKTSLPYKMIFDQESIGRIAIVTCGGPFDASTGNYLDNVVVFALPELATAT